MAILTFQKPDKVIMNEADDFHGLFEFRPLQQGFGVTVGNALRRVLLSSLEGYAITSLKIEGVSQEFSSIPGVMEDVIDIVLNLKQVRLRNKVEGTMSEKVNIVISGQESFHAGDMNRYLNYFQVLNPDLLICRMQPNVTLNMEITIDKGRGYVPVEDNRQLHDGIDVIAIDSTHTPIRNVKYTIEPYRVEQKTDFEKLVLDIETDGSIHPKDAIQEAAKILIQHFVLLSDENIALDSAEQYSSSENLDDHEKNIRQVLQAKLIDMDLSVRALNCLKSAELETLGDLVAFHKADLLKFRNFGKKSLAELEELVRSKGLEFGMNVQKYNIDNE